MEDFVFVKLALQGMESLTIFRKTPNNQQKD